MAMSRSDRNELKAAKRVLENPGLTAKMGDLLGTPIEKGFTMLPAHWRSTVSDATQKALIYALKGAVMTMDPDAKDAYPMWHKMAAALSGGVGGFFGGATILVELPLSTMIMFRSIADIGRTHGESLSSPDLHLACLEVFALGGTTKKDDAAESGYFGIRTALARAVGEASEFLAEKSVVDEGAPAIVRLIVAVAAKFQVQVSEKAAAMAVPFIGAVGGGAINLLFIDHFQTMSRGHFTVRRLERQYGKELVRREYDAIDIDATDEPNGETTAKA